jgi:class 3 adenylate cyclase
MEGTDQLLETLDDQRTVRRIGAGVATGSYVSSPGNVDKYSTYGNAVTFARDNLERAEELRDAARAARRGQ